MVDVAPPPPHPGPAPQLGPPRPLGPIGPVSRTPARCALGLSLLPLVPALVAAVVLAVITLRTPREHGDPGRRLAWVALFLVAAWTSVIAALVMVAFADTASRSSNGDVTAAGSVTILDLRTGDCLESLPSTSSVSRTVDLVPCSRPHAAEVFAVFDLPAGPYPGRDEAGRLAEGGCVKRAEGVTGRVFMLYPPDGASWAASRAVDCLATGTPADPRA